MSCTLPNNESSHCIFIEINLNPSPRTRLAMSRATISRLEITYNIHTMLENYHYITHIDPHGTGIPFDTGICPASLKQRLQGEPW